MNSKTNTVRAILLDATECDRPEADHPATIEICADDLQRILERHITEPAQCLQQIAVPVTRFCPECGHVGDVGATHWDCCPDGSSAFTVPAKWANDLRAGFKAQLAAAPQPVQPAVPVDAVTDLKNALADATEIRQQLRLMEEHARGDVWRWQADAANELASMGNRMGVLILASDLRNLLAAPAHPAEGVPTSSELRERLARLEATCNAHTTPAVYEAIADSKAALDELDEARKRVGISLAATQPAPQAVLPAVPMFWVRLLRDGLYEGPVHNNSTEGKLLRDAKPGEWHPLYLHAAPAHPAEGVPAAETVEQIEVPIDEQAFDSLLSDCESAGTQYHGPSYERGFLTGKIVATDEAKVLAATQPAAPKWWDYAGDLEKKNQLVITLENVNEGKHWHATTNHFDWMVGGYNTAQEALRRALEQAGYVAPAQAVQPALPEGWVPCVITYEGQQPEEIAYGPQIMMGRLKKWLERYFEMRTGPAQPADGVPALTGEALSEVRHAFWRKYGRNPIADDVSFAKMVVSAFATQPAAQGRDLMAVIKAVADKLDAAKRCHPNAVEPLIDEALELLDGDREPAAQGLDALTQAARSVLVERARQISAEGYTPEQDDGYNPGVLALHGGLYACHAYDNLTKKRTPEGWQWDAKWWKSKDPRSNLVKAGALILAEIERIDRSCAAQAKQGGA